MSLGWISCLVVCLTGIPEKKLELGPVQATYGHLGALRPKDVGALPGEITHFLFEIKNLKLDENNRASYSIAIEIRDEQGKLFYEQKPYNSIAQNFLGGNSLPCAAHIEIPLDARPGAVSWKLTVTDRTTKQSAIATGKGKIRPADFGIVQAGLFADVEARVPMSPVGVVGNSAYLQFAAVGFARHKEKKQPDLHVAMRILDEAGKPTMSKAISGQINADVAADALLLPMQFSLTFNRPGRFTIELSAEDRISGKTAQIRYALRVLPLE